MENLTRKVELRSLNKDTFGGLALYPNTQGTVLVCRKAKNGYVTGLTKEEETEYEKKLGEVPGTLNNRNDAFWSTLETRIKTKTILDLSNPLDFLRYKYLSVYGKMICPSVLDQQKYPEAKYVIHDEEHQAEIEASKIDWKMEASQAFYDLSEESKKEMLTVFGRKNLSTASPALIKTTLFKLMEDDPKLFVKTVKDPNLKTRVFIERLIEESILTKERGMYKFGDDILATGLDDMVIFLNSPKNAELVIAIRKKLDKTKEDKAAARA